VTDERHHVHVRDDLVIAESAGGQVNAVGPLVEQSVIVAAVVAVVAPLRRLELGEGIGTEEGQGGAVRTRRCSVAPQSCEHGEVHRIGAKASLGREADRIRPRDVFRPIRSTRHHPAIGVGLGHPLALLLAVEHGEVGNVVEVLHPEAGIQPIGRKQQVFHEDVEPHAGRRLEHCGRHTEVEVGVLEVGPRLLGPPHIVRVVCPALSQHRGEGRHLGNGAVGVGQEGAVSIAIADARSVRQQVAEGQRRFRMIGVEGGILKHITNGGVEVEGALLIELGGGQGDHGLADRRDAVVGGRIYRQLGRDVAEAAVRFQGQGVPTPRGHAHARELMLIDQVLEGRLRKGLERYQGQTCQTESEEGEGGLRAHARKVRRVFNSTPRAPPVERWEWPPRSGEWTTACSIPQRRCRTSCRGGC